MSLKQHAQEVLELIERGTYTADGSVVSIESEIKSSLDGSRLYSPDELATLRERLPVGDTPAIDVVNGTTQTVA
jgi:hypothetical protein